jgi:hypothetical protein
MAEVEIHWPQSVATDHLLAAVADLEDAGVTTECLVQPVRRGIISEVLVLVAVPALQPMLKVVFEQVGTDAYAAARRFIRRLYGQDEGESSSTDASPAPAAVVFESTETGAQFVFTPGLPDEAFRAAMEMASGPASGRWGWDTCAGTGLRCVAGSACAEREPPS